MKINKIFSLVYYFNNTAFSFLLFYTAFIIIGAVVMLLEKVGIVTSGFSFSTSIYNVVSRLITNCIVLFALYQSFLALHNFKQKADNLQPWHQYFYRSGILFCIASFTNLLNIGAIHNNTDKADSIYKTNNFYVGINSSSVMIFAIGILLIFIAALKIAALKFTSTESLNANTVLAGNSGEAEAL